MEVECLMCGKAVAVSGEQWSSTPLPAALCPECVAEARPSVVRAIYLIRAELAGARAFFQGMSHRMSDAESSISKLRGAQQELEEELLK